MGNFLGIMDACEVEPLVAVGPRLLVRRTGRLVTRCRPWFHAPAGPRSSSPKAVRIRLFVALVARPS